jgi:hypothetical protein
MVAFICGVHHLIRGPCHVFSEFIAAISVYAGRVAGRYGDHRHPSGPAVASRSARAGIGAENELRRQPAASWDGDAELSANYRKLPDRRPFECALSLGDNCLPVSVNTKSPAAQLESSAPNRFGSELELGVSDFAAT